MGDDKKKLAIVVTAVVVAAGFAAFMFQRSGIAGEQGRAVGSLEEGVNKETGLPLDPPKNDGAAVGGADPSMPGN